MLLRLPKAKELGAKNASYADWPPAFLLQPKRRMSVPHDATLHRQRPKIGILFGRLKDWRRIGTRYVTAPTLSSRLFCHEAGPTGYGLYRLITDLGHSCRSVAPSLIPRRPGDRVRTNRRDARALAKRLRADELTAVWVPDEGQEAMRDLVRTRSAAVESLRVHRQQVSAFMLKHGRFYPRKKGWTMRYLRWLQEQRFEHPARQIALQERGEGVRIAKKHVTRLESAIAGFVPSWSLGPVVIALQTLRGVDPIVAVTFVAEVGDVSRFESPRQLMGCLGLVPSERSTGDTVRRGGITKAGNERVRHMLVESAWTYRHPPRIGAAKPYKLEAAPAKVREIAWKAQSRLTARYRTLIAPGKKTAVVCTAVARELAGFVGVGCQGGQGRLTSALARAASLSLMSGGGTTAGNARQTLCGRPSCRRPP